MTKREIKGKQALRARLFDIAAGAAGTPDNFLVSEGHAVDLVTLSRFMTAVRNIYCDRGKTPVGEFVWDCWNLEQWETLDKSVDILWRNGARA